MDLYDALNRFYNEMTINELRMMNADGSFPNVNYHSLLYLDIIHYTESCTASYIAAALNVSKSAVTMKVNELIRAGLVQKVQSERDRRVNYLSVAPQVADSFKVYDRALEGAVTEIENRYSQQEIDSFGRMLETINRHYGKVLGTGK